MSAEFVDVRGQRLRVAMDPPRAGARPLLLLNGLGANLEVLQPFVDALGPEVATIRLDLPGVGGSPTPLVPYRLPGLARLAGRLLDRLGQPQVDVLGISWGGALAQQLAYDYPKRCRRLVLVSTAPGALMVPGRPSALLSLLTPRRYVDPRLMVSIAGQLYGGRLRQQPELAARYAREVRSGSARGYYWQLLAGVGWTSLPWLSRLKQRTLILSGRDDPIVPPINGRIMARLIRDARLHVFDDGHLGLLTSADELAPLVRAFLGSESRRNSQATATL